MAVDTRPARDVIVQCSSCHVQGTARVKRGEVRWSSVATANGLHSGCGGRLAYFDNTRAP